MLGSEKVCGQIRITVHIFIHALNDKLHFHEIVSLENILDNLVFLVLDAIDLAEKLSFVSAPSYGGLWCAVRMVDLSRNLPYISQFTIYVTAAYKLLVKWLWKPFLLLVFISASFSSCFCALVCVIVNKLESKLMSLIFHFHSFALVLSHSCPDHLMPFHFTLSVLFICFVIR